MEGKMDVLSALLRLRGVVIGLDILGCGSGVQIRRITSRRREKPQDKTPSSEKDITQVYEPCSHMTEKQETIGLGQQKNYNNYFYTAASLTP